METANDLAKQLIALIDTDLSLLSQDQTDKLKKEINAIWDKADEAGAFCRLRLQQILEDHFQIKMNEYK